MLICVNFCAVSCKILAWSNADGIYVRWSFVLDSSVYSLPFVASTSHAIHSRLTIKAQPR
jgi:hypothetical protein